MINYRVKEATVPVNYEGTGWSEGENGLGEYANSETSVIERTITNVHAPETVTVVITKTWVDNNNAAGDRPTSLVLNLTSNGQGVVIPAQPEKVVVDDNTWTYTYTGVKMYKYQNHGEAVIYSFTETVPNDYSAEYTLQEINAVTGDLTKFAVTNTRKEGELVITKKLDKAFTDDQTFIFHVTGPNGTKTVDRYVVIKIAKGATEGSVKLVHVPIGTYEVTEDSSWSWRWTEAGRTTDHTGDVVEVLPSTVTTVTFSNTLTDENWLSGTAYAKNVFEAHDEKSAYLPVSPATAAILPSESEEDDKKKRGEA